jgi:YD repeat-containing protein
MTDREHDGFIGPVKRVFVEWSPIKTPGDIRPGTRCRDKMDIYDERGRLTRHSIYPGSCGSDEIREDYTFDEAGNRMTAETRIRGTNSPPPPPPAFDPGMGSNRGPSKSAFRYDSAGLLIEHRDVFSNGTEVFRTEYQYDSARRLIEIRSYEGDQLSVRRAYGYDAKNQFPSTFTYYADDGTIGEQTRYVSYELNAVGDWIKRKSITDEPIWDRRNGVRVMLGNRHTVAWDLRQIEYYPAGKSR